jgi:hypothetical protein
MPLYTFICPQCGFEDCLGADDSIACSNYICRKCEFEIIVRFNIVRCLGCRFNRGCANDRRAPIIEAELLIEGDAHYKAPTQRWESGW